VSNIERGDRFLASGIALSKTRKFAILKAAGAEQGAFEKWEKKDDGIEIWRRVGRGEGLRGDCRDPPAAAQFF